MDWKKRESSLGLFIKELNTKSPPRNRLGLAFNLRVIPKGTVGLPTLVLMRIPKKGDTISPLTRRAKETASLNTLRWNSKTIRIKAWPWRDVTLRNASAD